jgi:hypothetical protein
MVCKVYRGESVYSMVYIDRGVCIVWYIECMYSMVYVSGSYPVPLWRSFVMNN